MGAKKITYTIGFKPQEQDLQNIRKQLQELSKNTAIKSNPKALQQLTALQQHTEDLLSTLGRVMNGDGRVSKSMFTQLSRQLQGLQTETKGFANTMRSIGLSPDAIGEVKELDAQLDKAKAKLKEYQSLARGKGTGFTKGKDGSLNPTKATQNKAARAAASATGMTGPDGRSIRGFKDFDAALNEVGRESEEGRRLLEAYAQAMNAFETEAREAMSRAQGRIKGQQSTISDLTTRRDAAAAAGTSPLVGQAGALDSAATQLLADNAQQLADAQEEVEEQTKATTGAQRNHNKALGEGKKATDKTIATAIAYRAVMSALRTLLNNAISTIKDMDKALTEMTVVTGLNREQAWGLTNQLSELAAETGMTTTAVANMTTKYLQQGKTLSDAITLTEAAAKAARIAGISGEESINLLTNAMNGFQLSADKAMEVSDKFASLAAASATDYEELATALSKVAAQANLAGMSMDFTLGLLAKGIETTREAPETIGTALKTVISRMRELTDYNETLEDGTDVNRVEAALGNVGVALRDANGEFRDLDVVLSELGGKWDTLNKNAQANVAVALAGTRQQSRLIAMMQDFDRTQQLVNISMNSAGSTAAQHRKYMQGLEAATTRMATAYQNLITNFTKSDAAIGVIKGITEVLGFLANNIEVVYIVLGALLGLYSPLIAAKIKDTAVTSINAFTALFSAASKKTEAEATEELNEEEQKRYMSIPKALKMIGLFIASSVLRVAGLFSESAALKAAEKSQQAYNMAQKANPILAIVTIVLALVAAWWALNKETDTGTRIIESLTRIFKSLMPIINFVVDILGILLNIIMIPLNIVMQALAYLLEIIAPAFELLGKIFETLSKVINFVTKSLSNIKVKIPKELTGFLTTLASFALGGPIIGGLVAVLGVLEQFGIIESLNSWIDDTVKKFESAEAKSARTAEEIAKNQEKIYDARERKNTLQPLLDEYDELSKKSVKTAEDLARMKEIEASIGDVDKEKYIDEKTGKVKFDIVREDVDEATKVVDDGIVENFQLALEGIGTGLIKQEHIDGVTDYYAEQASKLEDISAVTASNIASNFQTIANSMSQEDLAKMSKEDWDDLYNSVVNVQKELENENSTLTSSFEAYENQLKNVPEEAKEAFNSMYSIYAEYANLMDKLGVKGRERTEFLAKLEMLGVTEADYNDLRDAFMETTGKSAEEFQDWFGKSVKQGDTRETILENMVKGYGNNQELLNAVESAVLGEMKDDMDAYKKELSKADNLAELSKKYANGTITDDELAELQAQYPELFIKGSANYEAFRSGTYTGEDIRAAAKSNYQDSLRARKVLSQDEGIDQLYDEMIERSEYMELYSTELWKNYGQQTKEQKEQLRIKNELAKIEKELSDLSEEDVEYGRKKIELLSRQRDLLLQQQADAQALLEKAGLSQGANKFMTLTQDGEVILDETALKEAFGEGSAYYDFIIKNQDQIIEAWKTTLDVEEKLSDNTDEYRSVLEWQYEKEKELLEKQQEQYEDYFDQLDAAREDEERAKKRETVAAQLAAISGGFGSSARSQQKELLQQLKEIEQEQLDAERERQRDEFIKSIEDHVASIDTKIGNLATMSQEQLESLIGTYVYNTSPHNANGGLVDYTGPAWVDGTKTRPEAFLNPIQTNLIARLVAGLEIQGTNPSQYLSESSYSTVTIGNITIQTNELNTAQDFAKAGETMAESLQRAMSARGIIPNVKR